MNCRHLLCQVRNDPISRFMQITRIRAELTQNQRKQRRLAGAMSARDADFLSRVDLKAGIAEQQARYAANSNMVKVQHGGEVYVLRLSAACLNPRVRGLLAKDLKENLFGFKLYF